MLGESDIPPGDRFTRPGDDIFPARLSLANTVRGGSLPEAAASVQDACAEHFCDGIDDARAANALDHRGARLILVAPLLPVYDFVTGLRCPRIDLDVLNGT